MVAWTPGWRAQPPQHLSGQTLSRQGLLAMSAKIGQPSDGEKDLQGQEHGR